MQRALTVVLFVSSGFLFGCHPPLPIAIQNKTGRDVQIDVADSTKGRAYGLLEADNKLLLEGTIDDIREIKYFYEGSLMRAHS